jgi:hypothetical protein
VGRDSNPKGLWMGNVELGNCWIMECKRDWEQFTQLDIRDSCLILCIKQATCQNILPFAMVTTKMCWDSMKLCILGPWAAAQVLDLDLDQKLWNFKPGRSFDALIVDVDLNDCINTSEWETDNVALVKNWAFMGDGRLIRKVL